MYELGVVHELAAPGEGVAAARSFMEKSSRRHSGLVAARKAMRVSAPVELTEFYAIVELWADAALGLSEKDLKLMHRLVSAQDKLALAS
jgi:DSF synthase